MLFKRASAVLVVIGIVFVFFLISKKTDIQSQKTSNPLPSQTNSEGQVQVKVTPIDVSQNSKIWEFEIVLDTHTVELEYDMTKVAILIDDVGTEHKAVSWAGPAPGGHHLQGSLFFERVKSTTNKIEIRISNVGDVPVRTFVWQR